MAIKGAALLWIGSCLAGLLISAVPLPADTIFSWIDDQGVRHFSDTPPPAHITQSSRMESQSPAQTEPRRDTYDQMVESSRHQADALKHERELEAAKRAAREELERRRQLEAERNSERRQLEDQIRQLRQRSLGPTFTEGMRAAQISAVEARMRKLNGGSEGAAPAAE